MFLVEDERYPGHPERAVRPGFTLIEMLVVVAIIAILAGILLPALGRAKKSALETRARTEVKSIETAVKSYFTQYGKFPHFNGDPNDHTYSSDNNLLISTLRAIDDGKADGNGGHQNNRRQVVFLEVGEGSLDDQENFVDPWEEPYRITVDVNYDNECDVPDLSDPVRRTVCVWSIGSEGVENATTNWLTSWK